MVCEACIERPGQRASLDSLPGLRGRLGGPDNEAIWGLFSLVLCRTRERRLMLQKRPPRKTSSLLGAKNGGSQEPSRVPWEGFGVRDEDRRASRPMAVGCALFQAGEDFRVGVLQRARAGFRPRRSARKCVPAGVGLTSTSPEVRPWGGSKGSGAGPGVPVWGCPGVWPAPSGLLRLGACSFLLSVFQRL